MRKLNIEVEAIVLLPVKVKLDLLVRADDDAKIATIIRQFAQGKRRLSKADVEDVSVEAVAFDDDLDADEPLEAHVSALLDGERKLKVLSSGVTDSR